LYKGNIVYKAGNLEDALKYNNEAVTVAKTNHYALLSVLQCEYDLKRHIAPSRWKEALQLLEASGAFRKREITTRIVAIAWALVAATYSNDPAAADRFVRDLDALGRSIRSIAHRFPVFFSPISKELRIFSDLKQELTTFAEEALASPRNE
jgi:hypothetical protein